MNPTEDDASTLATVDLLSLANPDVGPIPPTLSSADKNDVVARAGVRAPSMTTIAPRSSSSATKASSLSSSSIASSSKSAIYQINFDVEHVGKNKPQSKRVAIWRYGVSSTSSSSTTTVVSDHEARLTWSTHSGKYTISVDGEEVSSAIAKGSVLEHRWRWSHAKCRVIDKDDEGCNDNDDDDVVAMRVIACRKPPVRSSKDFRCYEFVIGGKVFRELPVYDVRGSHLGGKGGESGMDFQNEESAHNDDGKLMSILDVIEPGWRASGFA